MKTKEEYAKELGISRKTLYRYMDELDIHEINDTTLQQLREYSKKKNQSKKVSKQNLYQELEEAKKTIALLEDQKQTLERGQQALLEQVEYYRNSIDSEIRQIKESVTLLLNPPAEPKEEKKSFFQRLFK